MKIYPERKNYTAITHKIYPERKNYIITIVVVPRLIRHTIKTNATINFQFSHLPLDILGRNEVSANLLYLVEKKKEKKKHPLLHCVRECPTAVYRVVCYQNGPNRKGTIVFSARRNTRRHLERSVRICFAL